MCHYLFRADWRCAGVMVGKSLAAAIERQGHDGAARRVSPSNATGSL